MLFSLFDLALDRGLTLMGFLPKRRAESWPQVRTIQHRDIFSDKLSLDAEFFVCS